MVCVHARSLRQNGWIWELSAEIQIRLPNNSAVLSGVTPRSKQTSCYGSAQLGLIKGFGVLGTVALQNIQIYIAYRFFQAVGICLSFQKLRTNYIITIKS